MRKLSVLLLLVLGLSGCGLFGGKRAPAASDSSDAAVRASLPVPEHVSFGRPSRTAALSAPPPAATRASLSESEPAEEPEQAESREEAETPGERAALAPETEAGSLERFKAAAGADVGTRLGKATLSQVKAPTPPAAAASGKIERGVPGGKTYAVIIDGDDGDTQDQHERNVRDAVDFMTRYYQATRITVLSPSNGAPATRSSVLAAARKLAQSLTEVDTLVIYTTGHGDRRNGKSILCLQGEETVAEDEFALAFTSNRARSFVYIGDQCYSGGFVQRMTSGAKESGRRLIAISSTDAEHSTLCDTFILPFFHAALNPANDHGGKGFVNEQEAFEVAKAAHQSSGRDPEETNAQFSYVPASAPAAK